MQKLRLLLVPKLLLRISPSLKEDKEKEEEKNQEEREREGGFWNSVNLSMIKYFGDIRADFTNDTVLFILINPLELVD